MAVNKSSSNIWFFEVFLLKKIFSQSFEPKKMPLYQPWQPITQPKPLQPQEYQSSKKRTKWELSRKLVWKGSSLGRAWCRSNWPSGVMKSPAKLWQLAEVAMVLSYWILTWSGGKIFMPERVCLIP